MVEIQKRKKKGRPSKADLEARRAAVEAAGAPPEKKSQEDVRRSLRRRSFRYNIIDYDEDYLDEEDEDEEVFEDDDDGDDERMRRREKKVKLVLKLSKASRTSRHGRVTGGESDEDEEEEERREVKKRRVSEDDDEDEIENGENDEYDKGRDDEVERKRGACIPGTPNDSNIHSVISLPDKKQLELILDKLQKKDTYGVYAEPVDPEELPDYHDVIEHPMDFSTVRKKLANGSYSTLEQFESDVFLISSNAMQYNAPETIYHKQARAIKELAEKKFQRIRIQIERLEKEPKHEPKCEPKSEQKDRPPYSLVKKQTKKPFCRNTQEPVGSDFSSGATLATTNAHNTCSADHAGNFERPSSNDGPIEGISSFADNTAEKAEDPQSGRGVLPKFGRRSFVVEENRRATYNISNQPVDESASIFTTFEGDKKQLIPVGLSGEYSYARSLARFAANLGPMAWRMASKRIEQVLPPGFKYGRGWIGEYEPLSNAVLVIERQNDPFVSRSHDAVDSGKDSKLPGAQAPNMHLLNQPLSDGKLAAMFGSGGAKPPTSSVSVSQQQNLLCRGSGGPENVTLKRVESNCVSLNNRKSSAVFQQQNQLPRDSVCPDNIGAKKVEPNSPSISDQKMNDVPQKQLPYHREIGGKRVEPNSPSTDNLKRDHVPQKQPCVEMPSLKPAEPIPKGKSFLQSLPFKQPDTNGGAPEGLSNGKITKSIVDGNHRMVASSPGVISSQLAGAGGPQRQDQGLSDPVLVMKMLTEKAQRQQNGSMHAHNPSQARPSIPSPRGDSGGSAAAAAASAWMSVGAAGFRPAAQNPATNRSQISADSLYNGTRVFYPQVMQSRVEHPVSGMMHSQPEKKGLPFQSFVPQPISKVSNEAQVQSRQMVFPQLVANDLSRFQVQGPWRGLSPHTQQKQKQDSLPPDLNVAFQSSVDSQQPDLALQL